MGLAKELNDTHKPDKDGLYNLTGMTGSPRYMVSSFTLHSVCPCVGSLQLLAATSSRVFPFLRSLGP